MRRYLNLDTLKIQSDRQYEAVVTEERVRRNDWLRYDLGFVRSGSAATLDMGGGPPITFTAKKSIGDQRYDESYTLAANTFNKIVEPDGLIFYRGIIPITSGKIDASLGVDTLTQNEIVFIQCLPDIAGSLRGRHILLSTGAAAGFDFWFQVGGTGAAPTPTTGYTQVMVAIAEDASAAVVGTNLSTAIDAAAGMSSALTDDDGGLTATVDANGAVADPESLDSGFTMTVQQSGATAFVLPDQKELALIAEISVEIDGSPQTSVAFPFIVENNLRRDPVTPAPDLTRFRSGTVAIPNGQSYVDVVFGTPFGSAAWWFDSLVLRNVTDAPALNLLLGAVTAKADTGFTVQLSADTNTTNFNLDYICEI